MVDFLVMSPNELIEYICSNTPDFFRGAITAWMDDNPAFHVFVEKYRDKIRAKVRGSKADNDLRDLFWELEITHLLSKNPKLQIEYEPYGTGTFRSPDYRVSHSDRNSFNVEARLIREGVSEARFEAWEKDMREAIRETPSQVGVTLNVHTMQPYPDLLNQLEAHRDEIKEAILKRIDQANAQLAPGQSSRYPIPGLEGIMNIEITRPRFKANLKQTSYYGGSFPIWFTQREFTKFGDIICEKLGQLRCGMPNVLAICSRSATLEASDFEDAIEELASLITTQDDDFFQKKGFKGTADFLAQFRNLTGILFRSSWRGSDDRNFVWRNSHSVHPIGDEIWEYLKRMD